MGSHSGSSLFPFLTGQKNVQLAVSFCDTGSRKDSYAYVSFHKEISSLINFLAGKAKTAAEKKMKHTPCYGPVHLAKGNTAKQWVLFCWQWIDSSEKGPVTRVKVREAELPNQTRRKSRRASAWLSWGNLTPNCATCFRCSFVIFSDRVCKFQEQGASNAVLLFFLIFSFTGFSPCHFNW